MDWKKEGAEQRRLDEAEKYEEEWTRIVEQEGNHFVVMVGFSGMTCPEGYYTCLVKPILERKGEKAEKIAKFTRHALACVERRRIAFERQLANPENLFRHITPLRALDMYKNTGFHRPDEWTCIYNGHPASAEQQAAHLGPAGAYEQKPTVLNFSPI